MKLSPIARELSSIIRRHNLSYDAFRAACHQARKHVGLKTTKRARPLPKLLPDADFQRFFDAISAAENLQHEIMFKLLFYTAVRVSEFCSIKIDDVDLAAGKIYVFKGKGDKDRYILFPDSFRTVLRAYLSTLREDDVYLFKSRQRRHYSPRRIAQLIDEYAERAGIKTNMHPHLFRHQALTWLTRNGLSDAQIQLISGHSSKKSLEVYQHMALGDVKADYNDAMRKVEI